MKSVDLKKDSIIKLLLRLGIPAMLAQFVNVLYSIVDRIFISNIEGYGSLALAGIGICAPILTFITSFSFLVGLGGSPLLAIRLGEGDKEGAQKILSNCFFMLLVLSGILIVVFLIVKRPMLMFFGGSEATIEYADQYLTIYILGSFFALLTLGLNSFIVCQGFSGLSMINVVIGAVLNIILDPLFIFVFKMGVGGAALATVISQMASCAFVIFVLLSKKSVVKLNFKNLSLKHMWKIILLGFSPFLIISTDSVIIIVLNTVLQNYGGLQGDMYVTVATIVMSFMQLVALPMGGITMGCQPILSYNYGAREFGRVKKAFLGVNVFCVVFAVIMFVFAMAIPHLFIRIFTSDPDITAMSIWGIRVFLSGIIFMAVQYACVDSLTALNQPGIAVTLSFSRKLFVMLTLILVLPIFFGAQGAFFAEPIADVIGCITSATVCLIVVKKILKKRELTLQK